MILQSLRRAVFRRELPHNSVSVLAGALLLTERPMEDEMKSPRLACAILACTLLATPALAQVNGVCLTNNQITGASAMDDRTMVVNDRARNTYVVRLNQSCRGLPAAPQRVRFASSASQGCLSPGDRIAFRHHSVGRNTCFVEDVSTDLVSIAPITGPFARLN